MVRFIFAIFFAVVCVLFTVLNRMTKHKSARSAAASAGDVYLCMSVAVSGRCPLNGNILSLAAVACTKERVILGHFSRNLSPLPGGERLSHMDVYGYWQSKPRELDLVCAEPLVTPLAALKDLQTFCKPFGRCTLVGSPLLSCYGWLAHYWSALLPGASMPWGFSGLCARSFAAGVLGVSMQDLGKHPAFVAAQDGLIATGVPAHDVVVAAYTFTQMLRLSLQLDGPGNADVVPVSFCDDACRAAVHAATVPLETLAQRYSVSREVAATHHFTEYPSITDPSFDPSFVDLATTLSGNANNVEWVVTEKVHGSNFCFICSGGGTTGGDDVNIVCAKRTSVLSVEEVSKFFNFDRLLVALRAKIAACYELATQLILQQEDLRTSASTAAAQPGKTPPLAAVIGELAGGEYVHPSVPLDLRGTRVQNGIQYHPNNFFYAFDIAFMFPTTTSDGEEINQGWTFLDFDDAQRIFRQCGILCAQPLFRGPVGEALKFNPIMQTTVPKIFGLPEIPENFAEGVVARPVRDLLFNGSRVMAKLKHPKFSEFSHVAGDCSPSDMLRNFAKNENRIAAVRSKLTDNERADIPAVARSVVSDALADVHKIHPAFECTAEQRAAVEAVVREALSAASRL